MKKILSMVLCILMVASVFAIPMTASASSATEVVFDPVNTQSYTVEFDGVDAYVYSWTPEADGTLTLVDTCGDAWVIIENANNWFDGTALDGNAGPEGVAFAVTAGTSYNVIVKTWSEVAGTVTFDAIFAEKQAGTIEGAGTYENPYVIDDTVTELPAIEPNVTVYYAISADPITTYNLGIRGNGMMDNFDLTVINSNTTVNAMMGQAYAENITPFFAISKIVFAITNTSLMPGGPYTYELTANQASTLGTAEDPDTLVLDTFTTAPITSVYYYTYTATEDGTLSINFQILLEYVCSISGGEAEAVYADTTEENAPNPVTYPVKAGEEITVWVANSHWGAGDLYFTATLETEPTLPEHTYNVAGVAELCGEGWNPAANQMTYDGDGTWSITFENVPAGNHEFKVVEDGAWGNPDFNLEGNANSAGNAVVTVEVDGSTVTIGFDGEKAVIESVIAPELPPVDDDTASDDEPVVDDATKDEPVVDDATKDEPVVDDATKDEPVVDDATKDEASKDESSKDEASKDEASKDEATKDEYALGDVNRDGKLNIKDVTAIQKYLAKLEEFDEQQVALADYNEDGKVSIQDATKIQKKLAKLI